MQKFIIYFCNMFRLKLLTTIVEKEYEQIYFCNMFRLKLENSLLIS